MNLKEKAKEYVVGDTAWLDDGYNAHEDTYMAGYRRAVEDCTKVIEREEEFYSRRAEGVGEPELGQLELAGAACHFLKKLIYLLVKESK